MFVCLLEISSHSYNDEYSGREGGGLCTSYVVFSDSCTDEIALDMDDNVLMDVLYFQIAEMNKGGLCTSYVVF